MHVDGNSVRHLADCYRLLDLQPGATTDQVKQAYRDRVRVWHPDRFSNDPRLAQIAEQKLTELDAAYASLLKAGTTTFHVKADTDARPWARETHSGSAARTTVSVDPLFLRRWFATRKARFHVVQSLRELCWAGHALFGMVVVGVALNVFSDIYEAFTGQYSQVGPILHIPGAQQPPVTIPRVPSVSELAGSVARTVHIHVPEPGERIDEFRAPASSAPGLTGQQPAATGQPPANHFRHSRSARNLIVGPGPETGSGLATANLSDGVGSVRISNYTDRDGVITVNAPSRRRAPLYVAYVRAKETLSVSGFGTGVYTISGVFGERWDARRKQFVRPSPILTIGTFNFLQTQSSDGMRCDTYEIVLR